MEEQFIEKSDLIHNKKYNYSRVSYVNSKTPVEIICPEHGSFWQSPEKHKNRKQGCPKCGLKSRKEKRKNPVQNFVKEAVRVHGNYYDYSNVKYTNNKTPVEIICPEHGSFWQRPDSHLHNGSGCEKCYRKRQTQKQYNLPNEIFGRMDDIHNSYYGYGLAEYKGIKEKIEITCPKHGSFWQQCDNHLKGSGCPECAYKQTSNPELDLQEFVEGLCDDTQINTRELIKPQELDIVIPSCKVAIEFNGLYWHSTAKQPDTRYHLKKTLACEQKGYRLIHIYEDEWRDKPERVKDMLKATLRPDLLTKWNARNLTINSVHKDLANTFLSANHIQGYAPSSVRYGLYQGQTLVAYMGFRALKNGVYELNRFASTGSVRGGFSKLLKHFQRKHEWNEIISYADRRWSQGAVYETCGFDVSHISLPSFDYFKSPNRYNRQQFMKHKLASKLKNFDPNITERENMVANGYHQIWNCGYVKFEMIRTQDLNP